MLKGLLWLLALASLAVSQPAGKPPAQRRYALLVGNSAYRLLPPIPQAGAEIGNLGRALKAAGFEVALFPNADRSTFANLLNDLHLQSGDVFFFYFSGYTILDNGENYLLPVDFDLKPDTSPQNLAPTLGVVQQRAEERTQGIKILMLDTVPAPGSIGGLQTPDLSASHETIFAFPPSAPAAAPGNPPAVGVFTRKVIANIDKPGSRVIEVFEGAYNNIAREFYFHEPVVVMKPGTTAPNQTDREDYAWVPSGTFQMGCVPDDQHCHQNEKPRHEVTIGKGFWIGINEVTVRSYKIYVADQSQKGNKIKMPGSPPEYRGWTMLDYPMIEVGWEEANKYCAWAGGRLPTEAEWEYAARAGSQNSIYPFDPAASHDAANYSASGLRKQKVIDRISSVRAFKPNAWGLFDMAGNVWEWVQDWYGENYYTGLPAAVTDPQGPPAGKDHVARGGGFDSLLDALRNSNRSSAKTGLNSLGFRCVLEDTPATNQRLLRQ